MDNILTLEQKSTLLLKLEKWECPVKYSYIFDEWALLWDKIERKRIKKSWEYSESELLEKNIEIYLNELWNPSKLCIFDFWCWTWNTIKWMLDILIKKWIYIYYHWFDISNEILKIAELNFSKYKWKINFNSSILDFETDNLITKINEVRKDYHKIPVLGMLLWNTVWNFDSTERVISNIMDSLRLEDRFIIWIEQSNINNEDKIEKMILWYKSKLVYDLSFTTLKYLWFKENDWKYFVKFNKNNNTIEWFIKLNINKKIKILDNEIFFNKSEKIKIFHSKKLNSQELSKLIVSDLWYRIWNLSTNLEDTYCQVLIQTKKYY